PEPFGMRSRRTASALNVCRSDVRLRLVIALNDMRTYRESFRTVWAALGACGLTFVACQMPPDRTADSRRLRDTESAAPYQSEVEEGLGAAVAIRVDTSGSMNDDAPGDSRPKAVVAREALEAMLEATDAFVARRPEFPIKIGIYTFSSGVSAILPVQRYSHDL